MLIVTLSALVNIYLYGTLSLSLDLGSLFLNLGGLIKVQPNIKFY